MRSALTDTPVASFTTLLLRATQHATGLMVKVARLLPSRDLPSSQRQLRRAHTKVMHSPTVVLRPEVILMDEPCSALDPISTRKIENLILSLKKNYMIVIVTHNMQQVQRISDKVAFLYLGELIEFDNCENIFRNPGQELTKNDVGGHFG